MQIPDIVDQILTYIPTIDYTNTSTEVSLFETTIRYLGGMLAGYDLLTGPLSNLTTKTDEVDALLTQSKILADVLKFAFNTTTGIPYNGLNITAQITDGSPTNGIATIGTLVLEWTRLSDLLGDASYGELAQKGESYLLNPQPASSEPFPGLVGTDVSIDNGTFLDADGGWVGGDDSFYEYLIKFFVYDQSRFGQYRDRWVLAADSTIANLTSHPSSRPDLTFVAEFSGTDLIFESEHLACFDGGNFILGGLVLDRQDYIDFGLALTAGCHDTYNSTATGIGPEVFSWNTTELPADQTDFYNAAGYYITDSIYDLRPEGTSFHPFSLLTSHLFYFHLSSPLLFVPIFTFQAKEKSMKAKYLKQSAEITRKTSHRIVLLRLPRHRRHHVPRLGLGRFPRAQRHVPHR